MFIFSVFRWHIGRFHFPTCYCTSERIVLSENQREILMKLVDLDKVWQNTGCFKKSNALENHALETADSNDLVDQSPIITCIDQFCGDEYYYTFA